MPLTPPNNDTDQYGYLITTEYGRSPLNGYKVQNVAPQVFGGARTDISFPAGTVSLTSALTASSTYTSLSVTAVPKAIADNTQLLLTNPNAAGQTQIVTVNGAVSASATSITVDSFVAAYGFPTTPAASTVQVIVQAGLDAPEEAPVVVAEAPVVAPEAAEEAPAEEAPVEESDEEKPAKAAKKSSK